MAFAPDIDRLIAEVAARHGILLKRDDAAFALVTLNQLVLEQTFAEFVATVRQVSVESETASIRQQSRVGGMIGQEIKRVIAELHAEAAGRANTSSPPTPSAPWIRTALALAAVFAAGLIAGMLLK
jgi:hypothetical protein